MQRLRTPAQFDAVLGAPVIAKTEHFALHRGDIDGLRALQPSACLVHEPATEQAWIGVMVPKRWAKSAVTRNLIRRQIYSVAREHLSGCAARAYVVRLRSPISPKGFVSASSRILKDALRAQLQDLLTRSEIPSP